MNCNTELSQFSHQCDEDTKDGSNDRSDIASTIRSTSWNATL